MRTTREYLEQHDIRGSQQRIAIMAYLQNHHGHPTVDEIFNALNPSLPTLSKTTIYNTLKLFEQKGAVQSIHVDEKTTRYDAWMDPHAHFHCSRCNKISDILLTENESQDANGFFTNNEELKQYTIKDIKIYLKGICPICKTLEK